MNNGVVAGVGSTSSPIRGGDVESSIMSEDRKQLADERQIVLAEAVQMADFALKAVDGDTGTLYQYLGYLNAVKERQDQMRKLNEMLLKPKDFLTKEEYMQTRVQFNNDALNLDIKVVEIEHKVATLKTTDKIPATCPTSEDSRKNQARKLETLRLEKFSGTVESWLAFWTRFEERVHRNEKLTTMEKYDYLRQYSTSNVLNKLKTIPLTEEFYETAISRLKEEFGSQERVMSHFTEKLLGIQGVQSRYDLDGLRSLVQMIKSSLTALQSVGLTPDHVSPFFTPILKKATPIELYLEFKASRRTDRTGQELSNTLSSTSTSVTKDDLISMVDYLSTVCEDMSAVDSEKLRLLAQKQKTQERPLCRMPTVAALPVNQKPEYSRSVKRIDSECIFCGDSRHSADCCRKDVPIAEKQRKLSQERRCFRCTKSGHSSRACREDLLCNKCQRKNHVSSLCRNPTAAVSCAEGSLSTATTRSAMTVQAFAIGPKGEKRKIRVLFDTASEMSFITTSLARALQIEMKDKPRSRMTITMFKKEITEAETRRVELRLQNLQEPNPKLWVACQTVDEICDQFKPKIDREVKDKLHRLNIRLADDPDTEKPIDILIGYDQQVEFLTHNATRISKHLEVVETALGWTLFGCKEGEIENNVGTSRRQTTACLVSKAEIRALPSKKNNTQRDDDLERQFRRFVEADALQLDHENDQSDAEFVRSFMDTVTFDEFERRFVVRLPMKEDVQPSENKNLCLARLRSLEARLKRTGMRAKYNSEIKNMIELGFLERVQQECNPGKVVSYLPHREVLREDSLTTKLRIVFDASAKERNGRSLNEALDNGPNLNADMLAVILNFRRYAVTVMADIEKSFPQIMIHEDDRDALRFLWDLDGTGQPQTFRLTRNYFGLGPSPFILAACIQRLLGSYAGPHREMVEKVAHSYYVDDLVISVPDEKQATQLYEVAREVFSRGSFKLRKWLSNSGELMNRFAEDQVSVEEFANQDTREFKVLGLRYDTMKDTLRLGRPKIPNLDQIPTKRMVLSTVASVFDRLGMIAPMIVKAKLIMQQIYRIPQLRWNDPVPEAIAKAVRDWSADIDKVETVEIPRSCGIKGSGREEIAVHILADASGVAYGIVAYIVITGSDSETQSSFLMARSRIAPLEKATIPRLELMALCLAAEACAYLKKELQFEVKEYHIWTDSSAVFYQVNSQQVAKMPVFVRNRVIKIRKLIGQTCVHHIPGHLNTADIVSRGCDVEELKRSAWFKGPEFLRKHVSQWPAQPELPKLTVAVVKARLSAETVFVSDRFGSWLKLKRSMAYVLRFIDIVRRRRTRETGGDPLIAAELKHAEKKIMQQIQREAYGEEISCAQKKLPMPENSKIRPLNPLYQEDFLCLGSRLTEHSGGVLRNPPILPEKHRATMLYLRELHAKHCHAGINHCLIESRKQCWIPRCRQVLRQIIHNCPSCKRFHLKPATASGGNPPSFRVSRSHPFAYVGTDMAGPLYVQSEGTKKKIWICVFSCASSRAVHLELLSSQSTKDFLMAVRRFKARRGCPKLFFSDNAGAYKKASEELLKLSEMLQDRRLMESLAEQGIEWKFNVEKAPWMNGFVEKMVGILKSALKRVIGRQVISCEELQTVVCEVEEMINRRPLCQVSDSENLEVLTPLHFLVVETEDRLWDSQLPDRQRRSEVLARWRHRKKIVEDIWKRWEVEYLSLLRNFHESEPSESTKLTVGQVVIVRDDQKPKLFWRLGKIEALNIGRDGEIRSCKVNLANNRKIQRPLKHLYPLEVER